MTKFNRNKSASIFKDLAYILTLLVCLISVTLCYTSLANINSEITAKRNYIKNYNTTFEDTSVVFSPLSYSAQGYDSQEKQLAALQSEIADNLLGLTQIGATMSTQSGLGGILYAPNFVFDKQYFTLLDGEMPNVNLTTATYVEALVGVNPEQSSYYKETVLGAKSVIKFNKDGKEISVTVKVVGHYDSAQSYPTKGFNSPTTIMPDFSSAIGLELMPTRGRNMYVTFDSVGAKNAAIAKLQKYGVVEENIAREKSVSEKIITAALSARKVAIAQVVAATLAVAALVFAMSYNLYKGGAASLSKGKIVWICALPIITAIVFALGSLTIFSELYYVIFRSFQVDFISLICASLLAIATAECGFLLALFSKKRQAEATKND